MPAPSPDIYGTWVALVPPLLSIALAVTTRAVHLSLFAGLWVGYALLASDPLAGLGDTLEAIVAVLADAGDARVILFSALVGAFIALTQRNGGVHGLIARLTAKNLVRTRRRALFLSWLLGVIVFVESSVTSLVNGAVCRPIFDRMRISREKLAWICDATAAPICILIPLNAWGAYVTGLLGKEGVADPLGIFVAAIPLNLYAVLTILFVLVATVWRGWDFGPMRAAEQRVAETGALFPEGSTPVVDPSVTSLEPPGDAPQRARNFLIPLVVLAGMMPVGLLVTGDGDMLAGSGSKAVFWAVLAAIAVAAGLGMGQRILSFRDTRDTFWRGVGGLVPLAALMLLAFAVGAMARKLGVGPFVVSAMSDNMSAIAVPPAIFLVGALVSFSTGTPWGTFALVLPLALPLATATGVPAELGLAAVLSGGIFGDHCSPISDTTMVASLAAGTDHVDHVRTQLPSALAVAAVTLVGFAILGAATSTP